MLKIGLTGGIGSGKSTVAKFFKELGVPVIDADVIAHELVVPSTLAFKKIIAHFGNKILNPQGELDRKQLRELIFHDGKQRKWLENLLHPLVYQEINNRLKKIQAPYCILVIPLLLETKHEKFVDRVLVVDSPEEQQIKRITKRDKTTKQAVKAIIDSQISREQRLANADDIIYNDKSLAYLKKQVQQLHEKYLQL
jgi:dephospho-CoA kinase